jgi:ferredoxin
MRVWIDQDLCTGDGLCVDHCPDVFTQLEDGIAYVTEAGSPLNDPGGAGSLAVVRRRNFQSVIHAAEACPGECIFIEVDVRPEHLDGATHDRVTAKIQPRSDAA